MERLVRGSLLRGSRGRTNIDGRNPASALMRSPVDLARLASSRILRIFSFRPTGASEVVSVPPAMPTSICPSAILLATRMAASSPVPQACCTSYAGVCLASVVDSTDSRVRLKSRACLMTAPATTSSSRWPCRLKRSIRPCSAAVSICWFDAVA
jgi:hypothetical protein